MRTLPRRIEVAAIKRDQQTRAFEDCVRLIRQRCTFDTREVWGKTKVPVKVTINGYTWRSTVGNGGGIQYIVVNAAARRHARVKAGDVVTIVLEPDAEKREVEIPAPLQKALGAKITRKRDRLTFTHKKEFIVWYSEAKQEDTRSRRVEKMKQMLSTGRVIS